MDFQPWICRSRKKRMDSGGLPHEESKFFPGTDSLPGKQIAMLRLTSVTQRAPTQS
jgi:hypothetical protein